MTRVLGNELPAALRQLLDGVNLAAAAADGSRPTFLLLTTDDAAWPHVAMLSVGEIVATDESGLRAALWLNSTTTRNLARDGRGVLALVADGKGYYVRFTATRGADLDLGSEGRLAHFQMAVDQVLEDSADYAVLTSGVTFRLHQPEQVIPRWQHTIDALRTA